MAKCNPPKPLSAADELGVRILGALEVAIESAEWDAAENLLLALEALNRRHACAQRLNDAYGLLVRGTRYCR